jgi:hypothetical protein
VSNFVDHEGRVVGDNLESRLGPSVKAALKKILSKSLKNEKLLPGEKTYLVDDNHVEHEQNVAFGVSERPLYQRIGHALLSYFDSMMAAGTGSVNASGLMDKKFRAFISQAKRGLSFREFIRRYSIPSLKMRIDQLGAAVGDKLSPDFARTGNNDWRDFFKRRKKGLVGKNTAEIVYWVAVMELEATQEFLRLSRFEQEKVIEEASNYILTRNDQGKEIKKKLESYLQDSGSGVITE